MSKIAFIFPCQMFLVGVDDEREGEMRHVVCVATDPKRPENFTRALVIESAKAVDMQSGTGSIKGLTRGLEKEFLERVLPALKAFQSLLNTETASPEPRDADAPTNPSQGKPAVNEAQQMLEGVVAGGEVMADETTPDQPRINPYKVRALGTHVLVKLDEVPDKIGSIIVPDGSYERSECWATVVSAGTGIDTKRGRTPLDFKKDDRVMVIRMQALVESNKQTQADMGDGFIWLNYPYDFLLVQEE